jgi:hypothetical protein
MVVGAKLRRWNPSTIISAHLATMGHKTPPVTHTLPGRSSEAYA